MDDVKDIEELTDRYMNFDDLLTKFELATKDKFLETISKIISSEAEFVDQQYSWIYNLEHEFKLHPVQLQARIEDISYLFLKNSTLCRIIKQKTDQHTVLGHNSLGQFESVSPTAASGEWQFIYGPDHGQHPFSIFTKTLDYCWCWDGRGSIKLVKYNATKSDSSKVDNNQLFYHDICSDTCQFIQCYDRSYYMEYNPRLRNGSICAKKIEEIPKCGTSFCLEITSCPKCPSK